MATKSTDWRPGPTVCRCCLTEGCYKDISTEYFWMGKREVYAEMLSDTFNVSISYSKSGGPNSNSRLICEPCISRLRDASDFRRQVLECEKTFMQHLDPGSSSVSIEVENIIGRPLGNDVKLERVKLEKSVCDDDDEFDCGFPDDDDDDLDDQPLTTLASKIPKKETVDIMDLLDNAKAAEKRKSTTKLKSSPTKKTKIVKKEVKLVKPGASKTTTTVEKKKKGTNDVKVKWSPKRKYNDQRDNAMTIIECSNATPFRWVRGTFGCALCNLTFGDLQQLKAHYPEHSDKSNVLRGKRDANLKIEVSDLACELCKQSMKDIDTLADHIADQHNKIIIKKYGIGVLPFLQTGMEYTCVHCAQTFELFSKINTHINTHYPNNICSTCGKAFSCLQRFKSHLLTHELPTASQYQCTRCDLRFATKALRNTHFINAHGPRLRHKCPYCNESFKSYALRGKHLKNVHNKAVEYPCSLCPAVFSMCNLRTKHMKYVHIRNKTFCCEFCSDKFVSAGQLRNHLIKHIGEKKFQCQVCKKAYARKKTLKEHMRIHNNDRRFVCTYCSNAFVQKCSLQSHMRTHHPNAEHQPPKKETLY